MLNVVATSPSRRDRRARCARSCSTSPPGTLLFEADDPDGDDNGPGNYAYPTVRRLPRRARTTSQQFQVFDAGDDGHLPRAHARPDADVRQPARRAARRRLRARPGRDARPRPPRRSRSATTRSRAAARGAGCSRSRASASGSSTRGGDDARARSRSAPTTISRYITFSVPKAALGGTPGSGLGLHGRADRPGRLQPRPGARLPADAAGLPVRRVRDGERRPALHVRPGHGAEGDGRDHAGGRAQSDELDYTLHAPVTIAPVVMP